MKRLIAALPGDGIGPEIMTQALRVLQRAVPDFSDQFEVKSALIGGAAFDKFGTHFPDETSALCREADAVLFGAVGGPITEARIPKWDRCEANSILALRKALSLYANLRPVAVHPELGSLSPLRQEIIDSGIDILFVRELAGDIYFGEHRREKTPSGLKAIDTAEYTSEQIERIAHVAFRVARARRKKITSVDKANVLETSRMWREIVTSISAEYSDVLLEHMLVDNCAMQLIQFPRQFDVILTSNMFGDILSDAAATLPGSLGLLASASLGSHKSGGLYEPPSGSAPDIAGLGVANPIGQILSAALMMRHAFQMELEAARIELAVAHALQQGYRTADIHRGIGKKVSTAEMADQIIENIEEATLPSRRSY